MLDEKTEREVREVMGRLGRAVAADYDHTTDESVAAITAACRDYIPLLPKMPKLVAAQDLKIVQLMNLLLVTANNVGPRVAEIIHQQAHDIAPAEYHAQVQQLGLLFTDVAGEA